LTPSPHSNNSPLCASDDLFTPPFHPGPNLGKYISEYDFYIPAPSRDWDLPEFPGSRFRARSSSVGFAFVLVADLSLRDGFFPPVTFPLTSNPFLAPPPEWFCFISEALLAQNPPTLCCLSSPFFFFFPFHHAHFCVEFVLPCANGSCFLGFFWIIGRHLCDTHHTNRSFLGFVEVRSEFFTHFS